MSGRSARSLSVDTRGDSESEFSIEDSAELQDIDTLARTAFNKKGNFGRWSEVYLELKDNHIYEYRTATTKKRHKKYNLASPGAKVIDAQDLTNEKLMLALFSTKDNGGQERTRAFFKASDDSMFRMWLRCTKLVIGRANGTVQDSNAPAAALFTDPTMISDHDGFIIDCNDAVCELLGWDRNALIGKSNKVLMPEALRRRHDALMDKYASTGKKSFVGSFLKPRRQSAVRFDGSPIELMISLGEMSSGTDKIFIATMRPVEDAPDDEKDHSTNDNGVVHAVEMSLNASHEKAKIDIRRAIQATQPVMAANAKKLTSLRSKHRDLKETVQDLDHEITKMRRSAAITQHALDMLIMVDHGNNISVEDHDEGLLELLKDSINSEVERAASASATSLFRGEDFNTRKINAFLLVRGAEYLQSVLAPQIQRLVVSGAVQLLSLQAVGSDTDASASESESESEGSIVSVHKPKDRARRLVLEASRVAKAIAGSADACPTVIKKVFRHLHKAVSERFFDDVINSRHIVVGFILLRFFIPAIVNPYSFGLLITDASASAELTRAERKADVRYSRGWASLGRTLQCLANGSMFPTPNTSESDAKDAVAVVNRFIRRSRFIFAEYIGALLDE